MEAGLDSLGAVELRASLQDKFAVELPATLTFDYPNIASLAKSLNARLYALSPRIQTTQVHTSFYKLSGRGQRIFNAIASADMY